MTKSITYEVTVNKDGTFWHLNGKRHREDGPAIERADGDKFWYIDDNWLTEQQFVERTNPAVEMTIAEIEQLIGKRVKVIK